MELFSIEAIGISIALIGLSIVFGHYLASEIVDYLKSELMKEVDLSESTSIEWLSRWIGVAERGVVTTLVIYAPSNTVSFIAGWVVLKFAGGWGLFKEGKISHRSIYQIALLGNIASIGFAVLVGALFPYIAVYFDIEIIK